MSMLKSPPHLGVEEIVEDIFNESSLENPLGECFTQFGCDLDVDKLLEQIETSNELSLDDPLEECFPQFECDVDLDMLHEQLRMGKPLRYPSLTHLH
jgi:hypothetical protein